MNEKDRVQRQYLQEKMYEERAARLAELEYQRKIADDKAKNSTIKLQWSKYSSLTYWFSFHAFKFTVSQIIIILNKL